MSKINTQVSGDESNRPVVILPGSDAAPKLTGQSSGYEKISGPNAGERVSKAYVKKGWRNVHYVGSTIRTEVGEKWLARRRNRAVYHIADGVRCVILPGRAARVGKVRVVPGWSTTNGSRERVFVVTMGKRSYHAARQGKLAEITRETVEAVAVRALEAWSKQREADRMDKTFRRQLAGVRVTLDDSRRAGNCVEGTLAFCERRLGLARADVLAGGHLFSVPAETVLARANGQTEQAMRACRAAWMRETTVCI